MSRNVRNISINSFNVSYCVVKNGSVEQKNSKVTTKNERKITKILAAENEVAETSIAIIEVSEEVITYKILDIISALDALERAGMAVIVNNDDSNN